MPAKHMARPAETPPLWLYDGDPDKTAVKIPSASCAEGGHIMLMALLDGTTRLVASRYPGKYVTAWRQNVLRNGASAMTRFCVSPPHLLYEAIKRDIAKPIVDFRSDEPDSYEVAIDELIRLAEQVLVSYLGIEGSPLAQEPRAGHRHG